MPFVFPSLAHLTATTVESSRIPLYTSPNPPVPRRRSLEKLCVAFLISLPVKTLAFFPEPAFSISSRSRARRA